MADHHNATHSAAFKEIGGHSDGASPLGLDEPKDVGSHAMSSSPQPRGAAAVATSPIQRTDDLPRRTAWGTGTGAPEGRESGDERRDP